jgi:hypothetical protein
LTTIHLQGPTQPALLSFVSYFFFYTRYITSRFYLLPPCEQNFSIIITTMRSFFSALAIVPSLLGSAFLAQAAPSAQPDYAADLVSRASTCNTPSNRACWTTGFNINTDYETSTPVTNVVRHVCPQSLICINL